MGLSIPSGTITGCLPGLRVPEFFAPFNSIRYDYRSPGRHPGQQPHRLSIPSGTITGSITPKASSMRARTFNSIRYDYRSRYAFMRRVACGLSIPSGTITGSGLREITRPVGTLSIPSGTITGNPLRVKAFDFIAFNSIRYDYRPLRPGPRRSRFPLSIPSGTITGFTFGEALAVHSTPFNSIRYDYRFLELDVHFGRCLSFNSIRYDYRQQ